jgi:hypothetical protein
MFSGENCSMRSLMIARSSGAFKRKNLQKKLFFAILVWWHTPVSINVTSEYPVCVRPSLRVSAEWTRRMVRCSGVCSHRTIRCSVWNRIEVGLFGFLSRFGRTERV